LIEEEAAHDQNEEGEMVTRSKKKLDSYEQKEDED
jgi:hypothetical protein